MRWKILQKNNRCISPLGIIREVGIIQDSPGVPAIPMRKLPHYCVSYTLAGQAVYQDARGHSALLVPGSLVMTFPNQGHRYGPQTGQQWNELYVLFEGAIFDTWLEKGVIGPARPVCEALPVEYWVREFERIFIPPPVFTLDKQTTLACQFQLLLARMLERNPGAAEHPESAAWVERGCQAVTSVADSQIVDWESLAQDLGLSYEGFRRRFRRLVGMPPARYHATKLMNVAGEMMLHEHLSNKEVAERLGFANEFALSRRFKQIMGVTPQDFRRRLLGELYALPGVGGQKQSIHYGWKPESPKGADRAVLKQSSNQVLAKPHAGPVTKQLQKQKSARLP